MTDPELLSFTWPDCPEHLQAKWLAYITPEQRRTFEKMNAICVLDNAGAPIQEIRDLLSATGGGFIRTAGGRR